MWLGQSEWGNEGWEEVEGPVPVSPGGCVGRAQPPPRGQWRASCVTEVPSALYFMIPSYCLVGNPP